MRLGQLSGALAHEINQPLTAILANADAGARLIRKNPPDMEQIAAILDDIAADDRRAAGIIAGLRRLMVKGVEGDGLRETCRAGGALDVLSKPAGLAEIETVLVRRGLIGPHGG